jgi:hypothetical protein
MNDTRLPDGPPHPPTDALGQHNEQTCFLAWSPQCDAAAVILGQLLTWVDESDQASDYASSCALGEIVNQARGWEREHQRRRRIEAAESNEKSDE